MKKTKIVDPSDLKEGITYALKYGNRFIQKCEVVFHPGSTVVYLLQNDMKGSEPPGGDTRGYPYSYQITRGSIRRPVIVFLKEGTTNAEMWYELNEDARREEEQNKTVFVGNVLSYLDEQRSTSPLFFVSGTQYDARRTMLKDLTEEDMKKILSGRYKDYYNFVAEKLGPVHATLVLLMNASRKYGSAYINKGGQAVWETSYGRSRSVFDMWRHYLVLDPKITIFDVIQAMYELTATEGWGLTCSFCSGVTRTVFGFSSGLGLTVSNDGRSRWDEFNNKYANWAVAIDLYKKYLEERESAG